MEKVSDKYTSLFHYTNSTGLLGILKTQSLWSTNYKHLNDNSEIALFFNEKFRTEILPVVRSTYEEIKTKDSSREAIIHKFGGLDNLASEDTNIMSNVFREMLGHQIYITSFCAHLNENDRKHGLLSQWRGYGSGGGYAIEFDAKKIEDMLQKELIINGDTYNSIADVVYNDDDKGYRNELLPYILELKEFIVKAIKNPESVEDGLYVPLLQCLTRYKHFGFKEEKEVRIVTHIVNHPELLSNNPRPIHIREKGGELISYIELFKGLGTNLPIKKIIVGPHKEKENRKHSLSEMLRNSDIEIDVSQIPYTG